MDAEQLVRDVARLRRAHRRHPADEDIAAVRIDLERAAGPTIGRAAAARLLGVSQTALDRWVAAGDVPATIRSSRTRSSACGTGAQTVASIRATPSVGRRC